MLSSSFIHLPGVGPKTEQRIWASGICDWQSFLRDPAPARLAARTAQRITQGVTQSLDHLQRQDHTYFAQALPPREHWRAYPDFRHRIGYLDIETTGLDGNDVTLVGLHDGVRLHTYTKGENLEQFPHDISRYALIVTFFGGCFDLPFLRRRFPDLTFHHLHIDLCPGLRRLGLTGGLKRIENLLGIPRSPETESLDGWDAVRLWREWERGSADALALLKRYNAEDVTNLQTLLDYAYPRLRSLTGLPSNPTQTAP